jgi:hypothetical protein
MRTLHSVPRHGMGRFGVIRTKWGAAQAQTSGFLPTVIAPRGRKRTEIISISFPFGGVIEGYSAVFPGPPLPREFQRETSENLDSTTGGPNGFGHSWDFGEFALAGEAAA